MKVNGVPFLKLKRLFTLCYKETNWRNMLFGMSNKKQEWNIVHFEKKTQWIGGPVCFFRYTYYVFWDTHMFIFGGCRIMSLPMLLSVIPRSFVEIVSSIDDGRIVTRETLKFTRYWSLHPWRSTWNIILWRFGRSFSFLNGWFFRFHVNLPGCIYTYTQ